MIRLVRLNGEILYLNIFQILFLESIPETKVKLANGDFYLVQDSIESINTQIQEFFHACLTSEKLSEQEDPSAQSAD